MTTDNQNLTTDNQNGKSENEIAKLQNRKKLDYDSLKEEAKSYLPNYLQSCGVDNLSKNFRCLCPNHNDSTPSMTYYADTQTVHCFGCGFHGDIIGLYAEINGHSTPTKEDFDAVYEFCGLITPTGRKISKPKNKPIEPPKTAPKMIVDRSTELKKYSANIEQTDYWKRRGLTLDTVKHFNIGFCVNWKHPDYDSFAPRDSLIIPTGDGVHHYAARRIDNVTDKKIVKVGSKALFNFGGIGTDYVIVAEAEFDAMSIWQLGFKSVVGLGGVGNKNLFLEEFLLLEDSPKFVIIALDNDEEGKKAADWIYQQLKERQIFSIIINEKYGDYKDANEFLQHNSESLKNILQQSVEIAQDKFSNWTAAMDAIRKSKMLPSVNFDYETPEGYDLDLDGLYVQTKKDELKRIANPIIATKLVENVDEGIYKTALACFVNGKWRYSPAVDNDIIATKSKITILAKYGIDVTSTNAGAIVNYISAFIDTNRATIPTAAQVSRTGWRGDDFAYPEKGGKFELDDTIKQQAKFFTSKGNKEPLLALIKELKEIDNFNIALGAALAAPLVSIVGGENIVLHFFGLAGCGKTTLSKAVASLFVNPFVTGALPSANSTASALEYLFNGRRDLPVFIEDIGAVDQLDKRTQAVMKNLPYQFGNGVGRMRAKAQGGNRETVEFSGTLITNDEKPLTSNNSKGGAKRRLIELECLKDMITPSKAAEIDEVIRENNACIGKEWIEYIQAHKAEIISKSKEIRKNTFKAGNKKNLVPRHMDILSTIYVALDFFDKFAGFDERRGKFEMQCIDRIAKLLPSNDEIADFERVKPVIRDWILQNIKKFINDSNYDETIPVKLDGNGVNSYEIYGIEKAKFFGVYREVFKKMLANEGFSPEMIIKQLVDDDYLLHNKGRTDLNLRDNNDNFIRVIAIPKDKIFEKEE